MLEATGGTRHHAFERLVNFRDVGGYPTTDGRTVRWGRFYRSDALGKLQGPDWDRFLALGVRTVIDLRYPFEIAARGRVPTHASIAYHNLSIEQQPYDQAVLAATTWNRPGTTPTSSSRSPTRAPPS